MNRAPRRLTSVIEQISMSERRIPYRHTGHTPIKQVTHSSYWSHTHPNGHTPILLVTHPPY